MSKHKQVAILMAPFLALGGYILADIYSGEDDLTKDKKLVVTGECWPLKNKCEVLGIGMEMHIQFKAPPSYQRLLPIELISQTSLDDVAMSLIIDGKEMPPVKMSKNKDKKHWEADLLPFGNVTKNNLQIRLAVSYKAALHFAEFPVNF